jgi:protein gp37
MSTNTKIEWTDHTFNPWWGCQKVSPGCDNCYAEALDKRTGGAHWGPGAERRRTSEANWNLPRKWNRQAEKTGERPRVFCASMADVFDNAVPYQWRTDLWQLIRETPNLRWQLLTKRIGNAAAMLPGDWPEAFPRVGLMISVVNQEEADRDIPKLLATPAAWRGLSMEPLLGPVNLRFPTLGEAHQEAAGMGLDPMFFWFNKIDPNQRTGNGIHWTIVGGESGHGARPMRPDWARSLRDQCMTAGVPFHFKQWGEWGYTDQMNGAAVLLPNHAWRQDLKAWRAGKARSGRLLDGREWNEFPAMLNERRAA